MTSPVTTHCTYGCCSTSWAWCPGCSWGQGGSGWLGREWLPRGTCGRGYLRTCTQINQRNPESRNQMLAQLYTG